MCACCHPGGLAATALVNIAFGLSSSYWLLLALWGLNGLLQVLQLPSQPVSYYTSPPTALCYTGNLLPNFSFPVCCRDPNSSKTLIRVRLLHAGAGRAGVRAHPDAVVPGQAARHVLGLLDRLQQHRRLRRAHPGRHSRLPLRLEVRACRQPCATLPCQRALPSPFCLAVSAWWAWSSAACLLPTPSSL